jgi:AcrR family transcriptional regulator
VAHKSESAPRQRLLEAADKLFYEEGIHTVGIDRIIEKAGVAKASLYSTFGSKDALISEYLDQRLKRRRERVESAIGLHHAPRERLLAVFDVLAARVAEKDFRGCAFYRAAAEGEPNGRVSAVLEASREWLHELFEELARAAGARDPQKLARRLVLLYDGALVTAQLDGDTGAAEEARETAAELLDRATHHG